MTFRLDHLFLLGLLCAALHWLVARSVIAKPLWSRATGKWDELLRCPACSGFWIANGLWTLGVRPLGDGFLTVFLTGALGAILTPVFEATMLWGLERTAVEEPKPADVLDFDSCHAADEIMRHVDTLALPPVEVERFRDTVHRAFGWKKEKTDV